MDRFSALPIGRLDSVGGVGRNTEARAPGLASFLSQRANQVLGARQTARAVEVESQAAAAPSSSIPPQLARQMDQLQRLHSSISLPANYQGINVVA
ncbi:MAG: hypothetical protein KF760_05685 [Candidatus Eremiobacteraeota bacterium]|nr:hypothetical protein [Candidatus Eremiobacteraeota bacterium]MCW5870846.1 hypothetical protein [Candidatus Eremiobacteraeota bacterium]